MSFWRSILGLTPLADVSIDTPAPPSVIRALSMEGTAHYGLGCGGRDPMHPLGPYRRHPRDSDAVYAARLAMGRVWLDCSGGVSAWWGLDRYQPGRISGDWISCAALFHDRRFTDAIPVADVQPGDALVWDGHPGHTCLVIARPPVVRRFRDVTAIQCRSGSAPAIVRSHGGAWDAHDGIAVRLIAAR